VLVISYKNGWSIAYHVLQKRDVIVTALLLKRGLLIK
jgi:hypothetical protein